LGDVLRLVVLNIFSAEFYDMGSDGFYFNVRRELITAEKDWILANETLALFEFTIAAGVEMRVGPYSHIRTVTASDYRATRLGLMVMAERAQPVRFTTFSPFMRGGIWLAHAFRE